MIGDLLEWAILAGICAALIGPFLAPILVEIVRLIRR